FKKFPNFEFFSKNFFKKFRIFFRNPRCFQKISQNFQKSKIFPKNFEFFQKIFSKNFEFFSNIFPKNRIFFQKSKVFPRFSQKKIEFFFESKKFFLKSF